MQVQELLFGLDADTITALTNIGLLLVTLVFSAIGAVLAYRAQHPQPSLSVDRLPRLSETVGRFRLSIHNSSTRTIQFSEISVSVEAPYRISGDGETFALRMDVKEGTVPPGATASVDFSLKSVSQTGGSPRSTPPFIIFVGWHRDGSASKLRFVSIYGR